MATSSSAVNAVATNTWSSWPSSSSQPGTVMVQVVQVSTPDGSSLRYYPEKVQAPPGSWVQFQFYPKNHTVTQSTFGNPCVPINSVMSNVTGIKSGFMPVAPNAAIPVFSVLVNDTNPIWLYCGQIGHCQKGMAMVINEKEGSNKTLEAYKAAAAMLPIPGMSSSMSMSMSMSMMMSSSMPMSTSSMMMMSTSIPTVVPTTTKASPAVFTGAASREVVGSSGLVGLLLAGLAFVI